MDKVTKMVPPATACPLVTGVQLAPGPKAGAEQSVKFRAETGQDNVNAPPTADPLAVMAGGGAAAEACGESPLWPLAFTAVTT